LVAVPASGILEPDGYRMNGFSFNVDIEATNRCNADCWFCPRDQTPHQGLMSMEVFDQTLSRAVVFAEIADTELDCPTTVSICGLGEPLLNKLTPDFVKKVTDAGLRCVMSSNASLLDERRATAVLDAGLKEIYINIGDLGKDYEDVYNLDFYETRDNIIRFREMARDRCVVTIVLVDYKNDPEHLAEMRDYWEDLGMDSFISYGVINRGGALQIDHSEFETYSEFQQAKQIFADMDGPAPVCGAPFAYLFVGYDGNYYLCCSDWRKQVSLGTVFDESFASITAEKLRHVTERAEVCQSCNLDPLNQLTEQLRAVSAGQSTQAETDALLSKWDEARLSILPEIVEKMGAAAEADASVGRRVRIPLRQI
jgi:MoaA/NifB/PqqE/SkfB family radical SAM enzyme